MPATKGSIWVEGSNLHFIAEDGYEYRYTPTSDYGVVSGAKPGSIWIDGYRIYYIDANGRKRALPYRSISSIATAVLGSLWVESNRLRYIGQSGSTKYKYMAHDDYTDYGYYDSGYSDAPYSDAGYTDNYTYGNHDDRIIAGYNDHLDAIWYNDFYTYTDAGYSDSGYSDSAYSDYHDIRTNPVRV
jgi:hypothetical protein